MLEALNIAMPQMSVPTVGVADQQSIVGRDAIYDTFAVDDRMAARHEEGDRILINPNRAPLIGDTVLVEVTDEKGEGFFHELARLADRNDEWITLEYLNPRKRFYRSTKKVVAMHPAMKIRELLGMPEWSGR